MNIGDIAIIAVISHWFVLSGTASNISAMLGMLTTIICSMAPSKNAPIRYLFLNSPALKTEPSVLTFTLCTNSIMLKATNAIVLPYC